jgi:hypothetical protein
MLIVMPRLISTPVKASLVNYDPWSLLAISGIQGIQQSPKQHLAPQKKRPNVGAAVAVDGRSQMTVECGNDTIINQSLRLC